MRFTFVILLFCCFGADAQMIIKAHANYRPYAVAVAQNLLLDDYPNAAAAYSLRKLDKDYTGSAIRVRRSNDNTEQDIGFTSAGDLDTASLKTFVGANSGFVTTWYDQSGNARNATQTTANGQPRIMQTNDTILRLNNKVSIGFNGTMYFTHPVIQTSPTRLYIFSSLSSETQGTVWWAHRSEATRLIQFQHAATSNSVVLNLRSSANVLQTVSIGTFTASIENNFLASARFDVANNTHISYLNGTASATNTTNFSGQTFNSTINSIGATNANGVSFSSFMIGRMHELIIYTSDQSSNRTGIENNINDYYNIYWNGDFAGLLDSFPSSAAAYSLRNLDKDYLGPLVRVRRSSDNAEQDIFGDYYGNLDTVGLKTFVGANSGFVTTWYDQSGNARNATRTVAADQPRIINAGTVKRINGKVSIEGDGGDYLETASNFTFQQLHSVGKINTYVTINYIVGSATVGIWYGGSSTAAQGLGGFDGTNARGITGEDLNQHLGWHSMRGLRLYVAKDGTTETNTGVFSASLSINRLFGRGVLGGTHMNGDIQELVFYNSDNSANRTGIETNINSYYGIY